MKQYCCLEWWLVLVNNVFFSCAMFIWIRVVRHFSMRLHVITMNMVIAVTQHDIHVDASYIAHFWLLIAGFPIFDWWQHYVHNHMNSPSNPSLINRGPRTTVVGNTHAGAHSSFQLQFGTLPLVSYHIRPAQLQVNANSRRGSMSAPPPSPNVWQSRTRLAADMPNHDLRSTTTPNSGEERAEQNRKRAASREFQNPYLKEMAIAHAQNREPIIEIPVWNQVQFLD